MKSTESQEQQALIHWWSYACKAYSLPPRALFAIPNGGLRSARTGARLRDEGVRPGIPDLFLAAPRGEFHGLFIEMKRLGAYPSAAQRSVHASLRDLWYAVIVSHTWDEARLMIVQYLELPRPLIPPART